MIKGEKIMKKYAVYFSDEPDQAMKCNAINKTEARKKANQYIRTWKLRAKIVKIELVEE